MQLLTKFSKSLFLSLFILKNSIFVEAQITCSTPPLNSTELQQYIAKKNSVLNVPLSSLTTTSIPMHFWVFRIGDVATSADMDGIDKTIASANQYFNFPNQERFVKCKVDYINNTAFYNLNYDDGPSLTSLFSTYSDASAINVYLTGPSSTARGYSPYGTSLAPKNNAILMPVSYFASSAPSNILAANASVFAHELGHYLGLIHTFDGSYSFFPLVQREYVARSGIQSNCSTSGDMMCSTPADYKDGVNLLDANCRTNVNCIGGTCNYVDYYGATLTPVTQI
jgi:Pregnancy-associated plasma protein-A